MSMASFLERDRRLREMNKAEYCRFLGIRPTELNRALQSERLPSEAVQNKIAKALGVSVNELLARVFTEDEGDAQKEDTAPMQSKEKPQKAIGPEIQVATWMDLWALSIELNKKNPEQQPILAIPLLAEKLCAIDKEVGRDSPRNPKTWGPIFARTVSGTRILFIEHNDRIEIIGEVTVMMFPFEQFYNYDLERLTIENLPQQTLPGWTDAYLFMQLKPQFAMPSSEQLLVLTAETTLNYYTSHNILFQYVYAHATIFTRATLQYLGFEQADNELYRFVVDFPIEEEFYFPNLKKSVEAVAKQRRLFLDQFRNRLASVSVSQGIEMIEQALNLR